MFFFLYIIVKDLILISANKMIYLFKQYLTMTYAHYGVLQLFILLLTRVH
jgi:hypothetical protein